VYHVNVPESNAEGDPRKVVTTTLEEIARLGAQRLLAQALEEEVAEFLQRERYERREEGMPVGYRNGYLSFCAGDSLGGRPGRSASHNPAKPFAVSR
jgi:hypothetical protein